MQRYRDGIPDGRTLESAVRTDRKAVIAMKWKSMAIAAILTAGMAVGAGAGEYWGRHGNGPDIEVWTNKGDNSTYYFGEDVAVYFQAEDDCYVVVYDIDPSGEVTVLFPSNYFSSSYVTGGRVYRVPDYYDDYTLEVSGRSGREYIYAVASYDYINPPDFMKYIGYDYGNDDSYNEDYFVMKVRGEQEDFVEFVRHRLVGDSYSVAFTRFNVDTGYRHHNHYRYWDYDPYNVGSAWIGCNFPGAEIWIDGVYFGIAPVLIPRIYLGRHWVWVYYGGYPCYQQYFYVSGYSRYYLDIKVDRRYRDTRHRRSSFRDWRFNEERYRNDGDFLKDVRAVREKNVRRRGLPSNVIRDLDKKGAIRANAPILKQVRESDSRSDRVRVMEKRQAREEAGRKIDRRGETAAPSNPERIKKEIRPGENMIDSRGIERQINPDESRREKNGKTIEKRQSVRDSDSGKTVIKEKKKETPKSETVKETKIRSGESVKSEGKSSKEPSVKRNRESKQKVKSPKKSSSDKDGRQ